MATCHACGFNFNDNEATCPNCGTLHAATVSQPYPNMGNTQNYSSADSGFSDGRRYGYNPSANGFTPENAVNPGDVHGMNGQGDASQQANTQSNNPYGQSGFTGQQNANPYAQPGYTNTQNAGPNGQAGYTNPPYGNPYSQQGYSNNPYGNAQYPPQYGNPYSQPVYRRPAPTNGLAIAGFVISFFPSFCLVALVLSICGLVRAKKQPSINSYKGLAIAGIVISAIEIFALILIAISFAGLASSYGFYGI